MPPRNRVVVYVVAALLAAAISFSPTPYSLILPGSAIDVRTVLSVAGHQPPRENYYMTDVTLWERVAPILLLEKFLPGTRVVRTSDIVPQGVSLPQFDDIMKHAMDESQSIAAYIAEREAKLPVGAPKSRVAIVKFEPTSRARTTLRPGDILRKVNGKTVQTTINVQNALFALKPGDPVDITYSRSGKEQTARINTMLWKGKARLGVYLVAEFERLPRLPVAVTYKKFDVSGSSGGLMFAMDIYRTLRPQGVIKAQHIAGTGTIDYNGVIGPIEGAPQKLIAARREGATVFFVPRENYNDIAGTPGIKIIPVHTFKEALTALTSLS